MKTPISFLVAGGAGQPALAINFGATLGHGHENRVMVVQELILGDFVVAVGIHGFHGLQGAEL